MPQKVIWPQNKPQLLCNAPYSPSQPDAACRVWNLGPGRELGRVRKEAVGKWGTTFLSPHVGLGHKYHMSQMTVRLSDMLLTRDDQWKQPGNWRAQFPSLIPGLPVTVWSWTKHISTLGSPWKWVSSAVEFCCFSSCGVGQGQLTTFLCH